VCVFVFVVTLRWNSCLGEGEGDDYDYDDDEDVDDAEKIQ
jgi:hypothetical protein